MQIMVFCGLTWWKKLEYPEETIDLGQATTTLPHADTGNKPGFYPCAIQALSCELRKETLGSYEPRHEKTCLWHMRTTKAQINLRIRAVWSAPLLFAAG